MQLPPVLDNCTSVPAPAGGNAERLQEFDDASTERCSGDVAAGGAHRRVEIQGDQPHRRGSVARHQTYARSRKIVGSIGYAPIREPYRLRPPRWPSRGTSKRTTSRRVSAARSRIRASTTASASKVTRNPYEAYSYWSLRCALSTPRASAGSSGRRVVPSSWSFTHTRRSVGSFTASVWG